MANLTETITQELLDALDDHDELDRVLRRYQGSKGPLYKALAMVLDFAQSELRTTQLELEDVRHASESAKADDERLLQERASREADLQDLESHRATVEEQVQALEPTLNWARDLNRQGFGETELRRVGDLLADIAANQGLLPEDGVAQFFETVARYEQVMSLELEAKAAERRAAQAQAEVERWDAEARRRETLTEARGATIDVVERLLSQGIKEQDIAAWERVLANVGISAEGLASSLEKHGNLEALAKARKQEAGSQRREAKLLNAKVSALRQEQDQITAGIAAVRDQGVGEIAKAGKAAMQQMTALREEAARYGELQREVAALERELEVARALNFNDSARWGRLSPAVAKALLGGLYVWGEARLGETRFAPPPAVQGRSGVAQWHRLSFDDLMIWAFVAAGAQEAHEALPGTRVG